MKETAAYRKAVEAIKDVFMDNSVSLADRAELLEDLEADADARAQCCRDDIEDGEA